jgi:hypothetical protein
LRPASQRRLRTDPPRALVPWIDFDADEAISNQRLEIVAEGAAIKDKSIRQFDNACTVRPRDLGKDGSLCGAQPALCKDAIV